MTPERRAELRELANGVYDGPMIAEVLDALDAAETCATKQITSLKRRLERQRLQLKYLKRQFEIRSLK